MTAAVSNVTFMDQVPAQVRAAAAAQQAEETQTYVSIDDFVRSTDVRYLQCREGKHSYKQVRIQDMRFQSTDDGYDVFHNPCQVCSEAYQERRYIIKTNDAGEILAIRFMGNKTRYYKDEGGGRSPYLLPKGSGHMPPGEIHEARLSMALVGKKIRRVGRA